jgi:hypothetical protein
MAGIAESAASMSARRATDTYGDGCRIEAP